MDPITAAIVAVLPILAAESVKDTVKTAIKDAYDGLKAVIRSKWGETAPISKAIKAIEDDPTSKAQAGVLAEKVEAVAATTDQTVMAALQRLLAKMQETGVAADVAASIQINMSGGTVTGPVGVGSMSVETMTFGTPPKR